MLFTVKDYQGVSVSLSETTWYDKILEPVFGHPEVKPYLDDIRLTISNPEHVFASIRDLRSKIFLKKLSHNFFSNYFLLAVVKYVIESDKTTGYISTIFITDNLPKKGKKII